MEKTAPMGYSPMAEKWVKWALDENQGHILHFAIGDLNKVQACKLSKALGAYNKFSPARVCRAIMECPDDTKFTVGREYSPVIYAKTKYTNTVRKAFDGTRADEHSVEKDGRVRLWWD